MPLGNFARKRLSGLIVPVRRLRPLGFGSSQHLPGSRKSTAIPIPGTRICEYAQSPAVAEIPHPIVARISVQQPRPLFNPHAASFPGPVRVERPTAPAATVISPGGPDSRATIGPTAPRSHEAPKSTLQRTPQKPPSPGKTSSARAPRNTTPRRPRRRAGTRPKV